MGGCEPNLSSAGMFKSSMKKHIVLPAGAPSRFLRFLSSLVSNTCARAHAAQFVTSTGDYSTKSISQRCVSVDALKGRVLLSKKPKLAEYPPPPHTHTQTHTDTGAYYSQCNTKNPSHLLEIARLRLRTEVDERRNELGFQA